MTNTAPTIDDGLDALRATVPDDADRRADEYQRGVRKQQAMQFGRLKDEARALFGMVEGRPGVASPAQWAKLLDRAGDDIGNGRFILRYLGAERYLDAQTVAVLITLRQNLIAELGRPSTADVMLIDAAIVAYYNFLRVQGWIGNAALVAEAKLFGREPPKDSYAVDDIGDRIEHLAERMLPLQDRAHKMLVRSLAQLPRPDRRVAEPIKPLREGVDARSEVPA